MKDTFFGKLDLASSKESMVDYDLLSQMFCRSEEEIKVEE